MIFYTKKTKDQSKPLQKKLIGGVGMGKKSHLYASYKVCYNIT